jgi:acyl carrier protein
MSEWERFAQRIAEATERPVADIKPDASLMRDLGLDSLALAELGVALRETYETPDRAIQLDGRDWETVTAGQLFEDFTGSRLRAGS